jgi:hypothetical protein
VAPARPEPGLTNYRKESRQDGKRARDVRIGLPAEHIRLRLSEKTGDWPRRVGKALFVPDGERGPLWLTKTAEVFAWAHAAVRAPHPAASAVRWADRGEDLVSRSEFEAYLRQTATRYEAVEGAPHEPPLPDCFYIHPAPAGGDGAALDGLLRRFAPATPEDAYLIAALLLTLVWGGPPGQRPAFLLTAEDGDPQMGRGVGKTTLARVAAALVGGTFDVRPGDAWDEVVKRLLSDTACATQRVMLIDNVKTLRFSWADVEAFITSERVNGRKLYAGDGTRPNTFTVVITLNGASLSNDLAQRCVVVKLRRPEHSGDWEGETHAYVARHRWAIVGDLLALLRRPAAALTSFCRWGLWEREVLARLPEPEKLQEVIGRRREAVDDDAEEADLIREAIVEELKARGHGDPEECGVRFPAAVLAEIVGRALNERLTTTASGTKLKALGGAIPELQKRVSRGRKEWVWR